MSYFIIVQSHPMQYMTAFTSYAAIAAPYKKIYTRFPQPLPHKYSLTPEWIGVLWIHVTYSQIKFTV